MLIRRELLYFRINRITGYKHGNINCGNSLQTRHNQLYRHGLGRLSTYGGMLINGLLQHLYALNVSGQLSRFVEIIPGQITGSTDRRVSISVIFLSISTFAFVSKRIHSFPVQQHSFVPVERERKKRKKESSFEGRCWTRKETKVGFYFLFYCANQHLCCERKEARRKASLLVGNKLQFRLTAERRSKETSSANKQQTAETIHRAVTSDARSRISLPVSPPPPPPPPPFSGCIDHGPVI